MKKRALLFLLLTMLILAVSIGASAKTTLQVISWWETGNEALVQMKNAFEATYPDIEVKYINVPSNQYYDKLLTIVAGGSPPDVAMLGMDQLATFASKGALTDITNLVKKDYPLDDLYPSITGALQWKGQWYALPRDVTTLTLFYNKKIFQENNVPFPDPNWTWTDFLETCKKLTKVDANGKYTYYAFNHPTYGDGWFHWLAGAGGNFLNAEMNRSTLNTPEAIEALQFLVDLRLKYHVAPTIPEAQALGKDEGLFISGKLAMYIGGVSRTMNFKDVAGLDWDVAPLPAGKKKVSRVWANLWTIPRGTKNLDAAWKFLSFVSGVEGQRIASKMNMGIPALRSVASEDHFLNQPPEHRYYFLEAFDYGVPFPVFPEAKQYWEIMTRELDLVWLGQRSVEDAVKNIDDLANQELF